MPPLPTSAPISLGLAVSAATLPTLLAWNVSPSSTFLNQALALALWGAFVAASALQAPARGAPARGGTAPATALMGALALLALAVLWSWGPGALPSTLALSALGLLAAAALLVQAGASARVQGAAGALFFAFCAGWAVAGVLNAAVGAVQVFAPQWTDGQWIARSGLPGRAVGNLRQPNHLSSLLLWSAIAVVALLEVGRLGRLGRRGGAVLFVVLVAAVVLTASRTGLVSVLLLALWGLLDRRLARCTRALLVAAPLFYALVWWALAAWAAVGEHRFGGAERLAESDISGSRFGIWANSLALIRAQPWGGVGFGEFNFAWTLTPFPGRPTAYFDHAHNLPLQLAVELGLPLAALVLALLAAALWQAWRRSAADTGARCALMMVLMIGLHSLLEYPLWYAYFLLPAAWAFGYALGRPAGAGAAALQPASALAPTPTPAPTAPHIPAQSTERSPEPSSAHSPTHSLAPSSAPSPTPSVTPSVTQSPAPSAEQSPANPSPNPSLPLPAQVVAGAALVLGAAFAVADYARVAAIFSSADVAPPLAQRIATGQRSVFFGHHADYAAVTAQARPADDPAFARATHYLLDARLMTAWAQALAAAGRLDEARHVAARLREFERRLAPGDTFFAPCADAASAAQAFQCAPPQRAPDWRELRLP